MATPQSVLDALSAVDTATTLCNQKRVLLQTATGKLAADQLALTNANTLASNLETQAMPLNMQSEMNYTALTTAENANPYSQTDVDAAQAAYDASEAAALVVQLQLNAAFIVVGNTQDAIKADNTAILTAQGVFSTAKTAVNSAVDTLVTVINSSLRITDSGIAIVEF